MKRKIVDKYSGSKEFLLVYSALISAARLRGTVTYQEVAKIMGLPLRGSHMGKEVGHLLGEISEREHLNGRPMLPGRQQSSGGWGFDERQGEG